MVNLDRCVVSCNTFNDLYNKAYLQNEIEDLNLSDFNMITESIILRNDISCDCK